MKKAISIFLICCILCFCFSFSVLGVELTYVDIDDVPWAHEAIAFFLESTTMTDLDRNYFYPHTVMKRGDSIAFLVHHLKFKPQGSMLESPFNDVSDANYYHDAVFTAKQEGFIFGDEKNNFYPENIMTRQDFAVILYRIAQKYNTEFEIKDNIVPFKDTDISDYAKESVTKLQQCGVINGYGNGYFYPPKGITRAEALKMAYDLIKYANLLDMCTGT